MNISNYSVQFSSSFDSVRLNTVPHPAVLLRLKESSETVAQCDLRCQIKVVKFKFKSSFFFLLQISKFGGILIFQSLGKPERNEKFGQGCQRNLRYEPKIGLFESQEIWTLSFEIEYFLCTVTKVKIQQLSLTFLKMFFPIFSSTHQMCHTEALNITIRCHGPWKGGPVSGWVFTKSSLGTK